MSDRDTKPAKRAHRIDVDTCEKCPFGNMHVLVCEHPERVARRRPHPLHGPANEIAGIWDKAPPGWCPLRQSATIVAGPASVIHGVRPDGKESV